jgi:hypothetical protein
MKESWRWQIVLVAGLVTVSFLLYLVHYAVFHDLHHILIFLVADLAFLPLEVILITFVLHRLLEGRERRERREKVHMIEGIFFSEFGNRNLEACARRDPDLDVKRATVAVTDQWTDQEFRALCDWLSQHPYRLQVTEADVRALGSLILSGKDLLLRLYENPLLAEKEEFSEVLRSLIHLSDEIQRREGIPVLPPSDLAHLSVDISRCYRGLALLWVEYMRGIRTAYPYLFSLAVRTNPFLPARSPLVTD